MAMTKKFSLKPSHLSTLVFFLPDEILGAFNKLKPHLPKEVSKVTEWLKNNYVHRRMRRRLGNGVAVLSASLFPPNLRSVHEKCRAMQKMNVSLFSKENCALRKRQKSAIHHDARLENTVKIMKDSQLHGLPQCDCPMCMTVIYFSLSNIMIF